MCPCLYLKEYGCNKKCLDAQLDDYYKDAHTCGPLDNANVVAHTGKKGGGPKTNDGTRKKKKNW